MVRVRNQGKERCEMNEKTGEGRCANEEAK
jgi:hypothetical protein